MNVELNETVTLTRANYEAMKAEIADLQEQLNQKTIIKEVKPDWTDYVTMLVTFLFGLVMGMAIILF